MALFDMVCPPGTGCPLDNLLGLGLPETLLWVLAFAIIFGVLTQLKIFKRAPALLISIVAAFFVLMAAPAALITVIASMSSGLIVLAIGVIAIMALLAIATGGMNGPLVYWVKYSALVAIALVILAAILFTGSGGLALIGITSLPSIGTIPLVLIIIGAAVLWMLAESGEKPAPAEPKK